MQLFFNHLFLKANWRYKLNLFLQNIAYKNIGTDYKRVCDSM